MEQGAVFLDLDNTITTTPSEEIFIRSLYEAGSLPLEVVQKVTSLFNKYYNHEINDYSKMKKELIFTIFAGQELSIIDALFFKGFKEELFSTINSNIREEIEKHQQSGKIVVIISSTLDFIVKEFCHELNIDHFFCTNLTTKEGIYTGEVSGVIPYGETKETILQKFVKENHIALNKSFAYGDHFSDRFMLQAVGNPVAVSPDKELEQIATDNNWIIKQYNN